MHPIGCIEWPKNPEQATHVYLAFLLDTLDQLGISFADHQTHNPLILVRQTLNHQHHEDQRLVALDFWWHYIDSSDGLRDFETPSILMARLAICLLSPSPQAQDISELGDHLSWFFEVLFCLKQDVDQAIQLMQDFFDFQPSVVGLKS